MKTFETIHHKDLISNNDVIKLLEEVGFKEMKEDEGESGYIIKYKGLYYGEGLYYGNKAIQEIKVYLSRGYLNIRLTPAYINLDLYKLDGQTFYYHEKVTRSRSWYNVKQMVYRKSAGMDEFRNFLLLSICRDSFLDPEEEETYKFKGVVSGGLGFSEDWHDWFI